MPLSLRNPVDPYGIRAVSFSAGAERPEKAVGTKGIVGAAAIVAGTALKNDALLETGGDLFVEGAQENTFSDVMANPTLPVDAVTEVDLDPSDPNINMKITIKESGGQVLVVLGDVKAGVLTEKQKTAAFDTVKALDSQPEGPSVTQKIATELGDSADRASNDADAKALNSYQKSKANATVRRGWKDITTKAGREAILEFSRRQDRSRISKEYHEWDYCIREMVWIDELKINGIAHTASSKTLGYNPVPTSLVPTYGHWVDHESLRDLFKLIRRFDRARRKCGGKDLYSEQGHADRKAAVLADLAASSEFDTIATALAADVPDFVYS